MKHKHAEMIKAWADGATVQVRNKAFPDWEDCNNPIWAKESEYRIRPGKQLWARAYEYNKGSVYTREGNKKEDLLFTPHQGKWLAEPVLLWEEK